MDTRCQAKARHGGVHEKARTRERTNAGKARTTSQTIRAGVQGQGRRSLPPGRPLGGPGRLAVSQRVSPNSAPAPPAVASRLTSSRVRRLPATCPDTTRKPPNPLLARRARRRARDGSPFGDTLSAGSRPSCTVHRHRGHRWVPWKSTSPAGVSTRTPSTRCQISACSPQPVPGLGPGQETRTAHDHGGTVREMGGRGVG